MSAEFAEELKTGSRFAFGKNWSQFLKVLNEDRIRLAEQSLKEKLEVSTLSGKRFLDIGSGSGLFSLAARRLGAVVHSFDYDPDSVACTRSLQERFFPGDPDWKVESGSVLDTAYLQGLGQWDVVYSWGVLHHTGQMWKALDNVAPLVAPGGSLFIAIYNDQGSTSRRWTAIKRIYNQLPPGLKLPYAAAVMGPRELKFFAIATLKGHPERYFENIEQYAEQSLRGMSYWHDLIDWIGGYPFEVARPEALLNFYRDRGFVLRQLKTSGGGLACNEFVFRRV